MTGTVIGSVSWACAVPASFGLVSSYMGERWQDKSREVRRGLWAEKHSKISSFSRGAETGCRLRRRPDPCRARAWRTSRRRAG